MKELNYKPCNANTMKIKHAKRKQTLARMILFVFVLFAGFGLSATDGKSSVLAAGISLATLPVFMVGGKFKELQGEDLTTFLKEAQPEDVAKYYDELNKMKKEALDKAIAAMATKEEIAALKQELAESFNQSTKALKDAIQAQGLAMQKIVEGMPNGHNKNTVKAQIDKFIEDNFDEIKRIKKAGQGFIELKVVGSITTGSASVPDGIPTLQGVQVAPPNNVNFRSTIIDGLVTTFPTNQASYAYTESIPKDGDYTFLAEGGTKQEIDFKVETRYAAPKKLAAYEKLTEEAVTDIPNLQSIAYDYLRRKHDLKRENGILFGDGTGDNLKGATVYGRAFSAGDLANMVVDPNFMDVVNAAITDIFTTHNYQDEMPYMANIVMINPADFYIELVSAKNSFGMPLYPQASLFNRVTIGGATIIPYMDIPAGKIFVADLSRYNITNYVGYTVRIGWVNDDFIKNQFVILGESRLHGFVKKLDEVAFLYDDIATIKAAIEKV